LEARGPEEGTPCSTAHSHPQSGEGDAGTEKILGNTTDAPVLIDEAAGSGAGNLPLHDDPGNTPGAVMSDNVVEDTMLDLNQMSPDAGARKVNPLIAVPHPGLTDEERLVNRERFSVFLDCPELNTDKKGNVTKVSLESRNVWEATQFIHQSLFHNTFAHGT